MQKTFSNSTFLFRGTVSFLLDCVEGKSTTMYGSSFFNEKGLPTTLAVQLITEGLEKRNRMVHDKVITFYYCIGTKRDKTVIVINPTFDRLPIANELNLFWFPSGKVEPLKYIGSKQVAKTPVPRLEEIDALTFAVEAANAITGAGRSFGKVAAQVMLLHKALELVGKSSFKFGLDFGYSNSAMTVYWNYADAIKSGKQVRYDSFLDSFWTIPDGRYEEVKQIGELFGPKSGIFPEFGGVEPVNYPVLDSLSNLDKYLLTKRLNTMSRESKPGGRTPEQQAVVNEQNSRNNVLFDVSEERERQNKKWGLDGGDTLTPAEMLTVLTEETGEVAKEICDKHLHGLNLADSKELREELIQVAAVAVKFIQKIDRAKQIKDAETITAAKARKVAVDVVRLCLGNLLEFYKGTPKDRLPINQIKYVVDLHVGEQKFTYPDLELALFDLGYVPEVALSQDQVADTAYYTLAIGYGPEYDKSLAPAPVVPPVLSPNVVFAISILRTLTEGVDYHKHSAILTAKDLAVIVREAQEAVGTFPIVEVTANDCKKAVREMGYTFERIPYTKDSFGVAIALMLEPRESIADFLFARFIPSIPGTFDFYKVSAIWDILEKAGYRANVKNRRAVVDAFLSIGVKQSIIAERYVTCKGYYLSDKGKLSPVAQAICEFRNPKNVNVAPTYFEQGPYSLSGWSAGMIARGLGAAGLGEWSTEEVEQGMEKLGYPNYSTGELGDWTTRYKFSCRSQYLEFSASLEETQRVRQFDMIKAPEPKLSELAQRLNDLIDWPATQAQPSPNCSRSGVEYKLRRTYNVDASSKAIWNALVNELGVGYDQILEDYSLVLKRPKGLTHTARAIDSIFELDRNCEISAGDIRRNLAKYHSFYADSLLSEIKNALTELGFGDLGIYPLRLKVALKPLTGLAQVIARMIVPALDLGVYWSSGEILNLVRSRADDSRYSFGAADMVTVEDIDSAMLELGYVAYESTPNRYKVTLVNNIE